MDYQLNYKAVLKANFIPFDPVMYLIFIGFPAGLLILFALRKKMKDSPGSLWMILLPAAFMPLLLLLLMSISEVGSGWRLENGTLFVKTYAGHDRLELQGTKAALVDEFSSWRPVKRVNGYGTSGLGTGWYRLQNGQKAVVFRHMKSSQMVILQYKDRYYVISHPGVEVLYSRLAELGARSGEL